MRAYEKNVKVLHAALVANTPVILWGSPGTGKTATVEALGRHLDYKVFVVTGSTRDRTDFGGWPVVHEGEVVVKPFPLIRELVEAGERAILFADEANTVEELQAVFLGMFGERRVGEWRFEARIIGAANPPDQSVGGFPLPPPVANRLIHIDWEMDTATWARGMREGFESIFPELAPSPEPAVLEAHQRAMQALVASYLERNPGSLNKVPEGEQAGKAWPSFRSWTLTAKFAGAAKALGYGLEVIAEGVVGAVGPDGRGFVNFLAQNDLPTPEEVLEDFGKLPKREDALFATLMAVGAHVASNWNQATWDRAWDLAAYVGQRLNKMDIAVRLASHLARLYKEKSRKLQVRNTVFAFQPFVEKVQELIQRA